MHVKIKSNTALQILGLLLENPVDGVQKLLVRPCFPSRVARPQVGEGMWLDADKYAHIPLDLLQRIHSLKLTAILHLKIGILPQKETRKSSNHPFSGALAVSFRFQYWKIFHKFNQTHASHQQLYQTKLPRLQLRNFTKITSWQKKRKKPQRRDSLRRQGGCGVAKWILMMSSREPSVLLGMILVPKHWIPNGGINQGQILGPLIFQ